MDYVRWVCFSIFTALSGFRRNGVFGESVLEIVWGRVCSFVWGWLGSDGIIVDDCGVAELAMVVVGLVFLVEADVIGIFEIVVIVMMLAIVSENIEILVVLMMPEIVIATMLMVGSCLLILCLSLGAMCSIQVCSGHRGLREMGLGLWGQS